MEVKYNCDAMVADNKRAYEMKQAEFSQEVNKSKAEAELSYELQAARVCCFVILLDFYPEWFET